MAWSLETIFCRHIPVSRSLMSHRLLWGVRVDIASKSFAIDRRPLHACLCRKLVGNVTCLPDTRRRAGQRPDPLRISSAVTRRGLYGRLPSTVSIGVIATWYCSGCTGINGETSPLSETKQTKNQLNDPELTLTSQVEFRADDPLATGILEINRALELQTRIGFQHKPNRAVDCRIKLVVFTLSQCLREWGSRCVSGRVIEASTVTDAPSQR